MHRWEPWSLLYPALVRFAKHSLGLFDLNTWAAYILNLRGSDIPYNPLFHAYLFVGLDSAVLFVDSSKVQADVASYLQEINVQLRPYLDLWSFLRRREWGEGKVSFILAKPF